MPYAPATGGNLPLAGGRAIQPADVGVPVAGEISHHQVGDRVGEFIIQPLPGHCSAIFHLPQAAGYAEDIGLAIFVEVPKAQIAYSKTRDIEGFETSDSAGGKVP